MLRALSLPAALCAGATLLTAAPISWGPATDTNGKADLINGLVVYAASGGNGATVTGGGGGGSGTYVFSGGSYQDFAFIVQGVIVSPATAGSYCATDAHEFRVLP